MPGPTQPPRTRYPASLWFQPLSERRPLTSQAVFTWSAPVSSPTRETLPFPHRKLTWPETSPFVRDWLSPPLLPINASLELPSVCCKGRCRSQEALSEAGSVFNSTQPDSVL